MQAKSLMRAVVRGTQFICYLLLGVFLASAYRLRFGGQWHMTRQGLALIRWWMQRITRIIGIHITHYGRPVTTQVIFVSNHISFLDIIVISSIVPVRFLAKHTVRYWPVIGYLTALSGSLFINRDRPSQLSRAITAIKQALANPRPVLIFPEGTTSVGSRVLKFHSGLFQAAIDHAVPVQALTLHYRCQHGPDRIAAYIDRDNFLISLLRLLAREQTEVHLSFTPAVDSDGHTRQSLAAFCHARISQNLQFQLQIPDVSRAFDDDNELAMVGEYKI
jgi:1-acyl-sn-glycerol-3-phosphate acyltransferase